MKFIIKFSFNIIIFFVYATVFANEFISKPEIINYSLNNIARITDIKISKGKILQPENKTLEYVDVARYKNKQIETNAESPVAFRTEKSGLNHILEVSMEINNCPIDFRMSSLEMENSIKFHDDNNDNCRLLDISNDREIHALSVESEEKINSNIFALENQVGLIENGEHGAIVINRDRFNGVLILNLPKEQGSVDYSCKIRKYTDVFKCYITENNMTLVLEKDLQNIDAIILVLTGWHYDDKIGEYTKISREKLIRII